MIARLARVLRAVGRLVTGLGMGWALASCEQAVSISEPCSSDACSEENDACAGRGVVGLDGLCECRLPHGGEDCRDCAAGYFGPECNACPIACEEPLVCNDGGAGDGTCVCPDGYTEHEEQGCILVDRCGCDPASSCAAGAVAADGHVCMQLADLVVAPVYIDDQLACGARLSWRSLNVGGPTIDHFNVYRDGVLQHTSVFPQVEDWGLLPDDTYTYEISAVDRVGVESSWSDAITFDSDGCLSSLDSQPHLVREPTVEFVKNRCTSTQVRWEAPQSIDGVTGFQIYINGELAHERDATSSAFGGLDGLSPLARYRYSFAPTYGEDKSRVGPLVHVDLEAPKCHELAHVGPVRAAVFLVRFADFADRAPPFGVDYALDMLERQPYSAAAYLDRVSFGQQSLHVDQIFDWIELSDTSTDYCTDTKEQAGEELGFYPSCDLVRIAAAARSIAAGQSGQNPADFLSEFDRQIYLIYGVTQGASGGGGALWASTFFSVTEPIVHELGHTFGLRHAGNWECPGEFTVGPSVRDVWAGGCEAWIYGDAIDVMAVRLRHYSAYNKMVAGYLPPQSVAVAETTGPVVLGALESAQLGPAPILLTVPLDNGTMYALEYRQPVDFDGNGAFPDYAVLTDSRPHIERGLAVWLRTQRLGEDIRQIPASTAGRFVTIDNDFYDPYRRIRVQLVEELADDQARVVVTYDSD